MYVIRLTCVTIATRILVITLTLCYSIWAADPNTLILYGYHMLMQVNTVNTLFVGPSPAKMVTYQNYGIIIVFSS